MPSPTPSSHHNHHTRHRQHHPRNHNSVINQATADTILATTIQSLPRPSPTPSSQPQFSHYPGHRRHHPRNHNSVITQAIADTILATTIQSLPRPSPTHIRTTTLITQAIANTNRNQTSHYPGHRQHQSETTCHALSKPPPTPLPLQNHNSHITYTPANITLITIIHAYSYAPHCPSHQLHLQPMILPKCLGLRQHQPQSTIFIPSHILLLMLLTPQNFQFSTLQTVYDNWSS
ncbi:hypothetical protein HNY73_013903 [Argiope bruennichi]|uniref:Uncharacterized protein n=1 Tax=Argiope bruennichi TaxID=94029 RepID=A0A8T0ENM3_ARGBR|nr:hypothetical protein HNY73_013903 [Argiope bruennichi]